MTRKSTLIQWGQHLGVVSDDHQGQEMTMTVLEQGISQALVERDRVVVDADEPHYTLRDGIAANLKVLRADAVPTARAIVANLLS